MGSRIIAHPDVSFTVVVNPFNGPGLEDLPDDNYQKEISKLTCHSNVRVVGYIHTTWAKRDLAMVCCDIEKYAQWPEHSGNPNLRLTGVFVDETPTLYHPDAEAYLAKLKEHVKLKMPRGEENIVRTRPAKKTLQSWVALITVQGHPQSRMYSRRRLSEAGRLHGRLRRYLPYLPDENIKWSLRRTCTHGGR